METLEEQQSTSDDRLLKKTKISLPTETIEEIVFRLPVKSILRFRSVSKPWLSRISNPSFTKLHFTCARAGHRTALFISAYDYDDSTYKRHFLSAAPNGGPVTHLMTLNEGCCCLDFTHAQHVNGLVFFTYVKWYLGNLRNSCAQVFVLNPSTHKMFKLPDPDTLMNYSDINNHICYLFGFDETRNEHKILIVGKPLNKTTLKNEIMIFSMSSYSWRKIDAELPVGCNWNRSPYYMKGSVCVNSVVHFMSRGSFDIFAFDLRTEKFYVISTPQGVVPCKTATRYTMNGKFLPKDNKPYILNMNGFIGVVCHDRVLESQDMCIWILQDYENRVWVREILTLPKPWTELDCPMPCDVVNMDEIVFTSSNMCRNHVINVPIYNKKSKCFRSLQFTLGHRFSSSKTMEMDQIKCYVESMLPLQNMT